MFTRWPTRQKGHYFDHVDCYYIRHSLRIESRVCRRLLRATKGIPFMQNGWGSYWIWHGRMRIPTQTIEGRTELLLKCHCVVYACVCERALKLASLQPDNFAVREMQCAPKHLHSRGFAARSSTLSHCTGKEGAGGQDGQRMVDVYRHSWAPETARMSLVGARWSM